MDLQEGNLGALLMGGANWQRVGINSVMDFELVVLEIERAN